ncbi:hypothetical protein NKI82_29235 [Mesorhizobium sp. M0482]|uniref:hypothetical protein n=1 Tax=Mesorhizobium sp. M0482 TaxID=2956948 RepID=UPI00333B0DDF
MLGGYLARKHDPRPGNMVVRRGMTRLHDITFGISSIKPTMWVIESVTGWVGRISKSEYT